ncbi:MAG TPA: NFACT RNA binding domain-containing protein [Planctomycetota bacterium]|nr:NFACT RNA binding domain-containing protein [Planctomycetota bacterium]
MLSRPDLVRVVREAGPACVGLETHRIWRADEDTWILLLRGEAERRLALEVGLRPETARLCALPAEVVGADDPEKKKERKDDSHFFLAALRKQLGGAKLEAVTLVEGDRIVLLDFTGHRLVVELTGRASNLVLLGKEGEVVLSLRPGRPQRPLDPGTKWAPPPPRPATGDEPVFAAEIEPDPATLALSRRIAEEARRIDAEEKAEDRHATLLRAAIQGEKRVRGLVQKLEKERDEAQQAEKLRQQGELLKANAQKVKKGQTRITVLDYFASEPKEIELEVDPLVPVMDQARALFKRAKKLDRGIVSIETRLGEADAEAEALARLRAELEASAEGDLDRIEKELQKLGHAPRERKPPEPKKKQKEEPRGPRRFTSRDGFEILVGRSNTENDELTIRMARGNDLFFHVRGFPGSHVIVRNKKDKSFPLETLLDAGALAVHYSKVRGNTRADVSYTPRKYVSKPRGAKPGLVMVANEKTIRPDGDPERLKRLLATAGQREDPDAEWGEVEDAVAS